VSPINVNQGAKGAKGEYIYVYVYMYIYKVIRVK